MTLLGQPGSGKGFYGRYLAEAWKIPLFTASTILKEHFGATAVASGKLLDCDTVCDCIQNHLITANDKNINQNQTSVFIMDGFPRTKRQIQRMQETFPAPVQIRTAVLLDIPDEICVQKIQGRRLCSICGESPNHNYVKGHGFDLPPTIPKACTKNCQPDLHWSQRLDDRDPAMVQQRIKEYRFHESTILEHYRSSGRLFSFRPLRGARDVPDMQRGLEEWFVATTTADASL